MTEREITPAEFLQWLRENARIEVPIGNSPVVHDREAASDAFEMIRREAARAINARAINARRSVSR